MRKIATVAAFAAVTLAGVVVLAIAAPTGAVPAPSSSTPVRVDIQADPTLGAWPHKPHAYPRIVLDRSGLNGWPLRQAVRVWGVALHGSNACHGARICVSVSE